MRYNQFFGFHFSVYNFYLFQVLLVSFANFVAIVTCSTVQVYDGYSTSAPLIGTYCGNRIPDYIFSTGNTMTIEYVTDDLITGNSMVQFFF